jgi:hypothetical protein
MALSFAEETAASREDHAQALAIQIADEYARSDIECKAVAAITNFPRPVYDISQAEGPGDPALIEAAMEDVQRAVRYLDLRGLIVRPFPGQPQFVSFPDEAV